MKEINFHVVPLEKVPEKGRASGLCAYHKPGTRDVYLVKGKYREYDKLHETYHYRKKHPDYPHKPSEFVEHEVEAELYSYNEVKKPTHIKHAICYWLDELINHYKIGAAKSLQIISGVMNKYDIPQSWRDDFSEVMSEAYKGRKIPNYQKVMLKKV